MERLTLSPTICKLLSYSVCFASQPLVRRGRCIKQGAACRYEFKLEKYPMAIRVSIDKVKTADSNNNQQEQGQDASSAFDVEDGKLLSSSLNRAPSYPASSEVTGHSHILEGIAGCSSRFQAEAERDRPAQIGAASEKHRQRQEHTWLPKLPQTGSPVSLFRICCLLSQRPGTPVS